MSRLLKLSNDQSIQQHESADEISNGDSNCSRRSRINIGLEEDPEAGDTFSPINSTGSSNSDPMKCPDSSAHSTTGEGAPRRALLLKRCRDDVERLMARQQFQYDRHLQQQILLQQQNKTLVTSSDNCFVPHDFVVTTLSVANVNHFDNRSACSSLQESSYDDVKETELADELVQRLDVVSTSSNLCDEVKGEPMEMNDDEFNTNAAPDSVFTTYHVQVNPDQDDKAVDIILMSAARPHMRAFHMAWLSFFVAFFVWFSVTPLLSEISQTLHLTHEEIWTSCSLAVASSALTRVIIGPINDRYGARWVMAGTLIASAIPTGLAGWIIQDVQSLYLVRFFIGIAGSTFVTATFWTSSMFVVEIAGTANALATGWGNLGAAVAQIVIGSILFPIFRLFFGGSGFGSSYSSSSVSSTLFNDTIPSSSLFYNPSFLTLNEQEIRASQLAWRTVLVVPALMALVMAWAVIRYSDDTPKGNIWKRRARNIPLAITTVRAAVTSTQPTLSSTPVSQHGLSFIDNSRHLRNTLLLFMQYASCFGLELTMNNATVLYFKNHFGQSTESAAAIASVFGWMNLFARGFGGFASDLANAKSGMRGRLVVQLSFLVLEGVMLIVFGITRTLAGAIVAMIILSIFVQASEGSTFGIVPYVLPSRTGSIAGWVGAGGNVGGVLFSLLIRNQSNYHTAFIWIGLTVLVCSVGTFLISIPDHRGLICGQDSASVHEHRRRAKLPQAIPFGMQCIDPAAVDTSTNIGVNWKSKDKYDYGD